MSQMWLVVFFALIQIVHLNNNNFPEVKIKQGIIRGTTRKTWTGRSFMAFQGIPYAQPPIGELRFKPPLLAKPWDGVLDGTKDHAACPQGGLQFNEYVEFGDEDCLFINVYTPQVATNEPLPVLVYIHGGGFSTDSANSNYYGPDILLDRDVVLVIPNYRLGALGFLSLEDELLPGNNGLKDQNLALQWVKSNIAHFGGNPEKLTIFGNSAGGACVFLHLLSPLSKDLIFAAFSSSGIGTAPWSLQHNGEARRNAIKLANLLNCSTISSEAILSCLRKVNAYDIVRQNENFRVFHDHAAIIYMPVVEPYNQNAFLTENPLDIVKSGNFAQVPYISGFTTNDGAVISAGAYNNYRVVEKLNKEFDKLAPTLLFYNEQNVESTRSIRKFYFKDKDIDNSTKSELTNVITDSFFYYPQRTTTELQTQHTSQPVYFYLFGYRGKYSTSVHFGDPDHDYGVSHCDDTNYILRNGKFKDYQPTETDLKMNEVMTTLLYNFASTGNPTPSLSALIHTKWKPLTSNKFQYYSIKHPNEITMEELLCEDRYTFWKNLRVYSEMNRMGDEL